ncbi:competence/damage-inducible protein A [Bacillus timonensis]|nr:competence/damage-inducible protein A [Bacillus timonensis]
MRAEIIAVGSELLLGQIVNSNAQFISEQLAELGINVYYHTVVGDNPDRLKSVIEIAQTRSDIIIFTGGLGPTKDDLTKETISSLLNRRLVTDEQALSFIKDYFTVTKRTMTTNNLKQALVIEGSAVLKNDNGMAPGMGLKVDEIIYMLLPGPPKEMKPMFLKYGTDFLTKQVGITDRIESRVLRFLGIGESQLETDIEDIIDSQTNPTLAPLAGDGEVTLRITAKHPTSEGAQKMIDEVEKLISNRVGQFIYGYGATSVSVELYKLLSDKKLTISSAESLTGGLFQEQLTSVPGASSVVKGGIVCYSDEVKTDIIGVKKETIDLFGSVSEECAKELADKTRSRLNTDICISFTGVAGPSELEGNPVGKVFIGISIVNQPTKVYEYQLKGTRESIRNRTVKYGCYHLLKMLKGS